MPTVLAKTRLPSTAGGAVVESDRNHQRSSATAERYRSVVYVGNTSQHRGVDGDRESKTAISADSLADGRHREPGLARGSRSRGANQNIQRRVVGYVQDLGDGRPDA